MLLCAFQVTAQSNSELLKHYEAYYNQMKSQGDVQGVINALTHLNILQPNQARKDTLSAYYMNEGKHVQALNVIGIDVNENDSDLALEVKAVSLKALNEVERAIQQYEILYKRKRTAMIAYELADLKIQTNDLAGANLNITYGLANSQPDMGRTYYESQMPYQVPIKAAFLYLKGLAKYRENPEINMDLAIASLDEALQLAPNFNLAQISKEALLAQKSGAKKE